MFVYFQKNLELQETGTVEETTHRMIREAPICSGLHQLLDRFRPRGRFSLHLRGSLEYCEHIVAVGIVRSVAE